MRRRRARHENLLRLPKLARPVQEMLMEGALEMGHAAPLLALEAARQIEAGSASRRSACGARDRALVQSLLRGPRRDAARGLTAICAAEEEVSERSALR